MGVTWRDDGEWRMVSPLKEEVWAHRMEGFEDADFILETIRHGYRFADPEKVTPVDMRNYKSFEEGGEAVDRVLQDEVERGWIMKWVSKEMPRVISARGAVPKQDSSELRLITDYSRPKGKAVNDYVFPRQVLDDFGGCCDGVDASRLLDV